MGRVVGSRATKVRNKKNARPESKKKKPPFWDGLLTVDQAAQVFLFNNHFQDLLGIISHDIEVIDSRCQPGNI